MGFEIENGILTKYIEEPGVKNVVVPEGVTEIGKRAFSSCHQLTGVTIPRSVTRIGSCAFAHCGALSSVTIENPGIVIGDGAFWLCRELADAQGFVIFGGRLCGYWGEDTEPVIPDGVTSIDQCAFRARSDLTAVTIPESVTRISFAAFSYCRRLAHVNIPAGVTEIVDSAFFSCRSLTRVDIPAGVTEIGPCAFDYCDSLADVTITAQTLKHCDDHTIWRCVIRRTASGEKDAAVLAEALESCPEYYRKEAEAALRGEPVTGLS